MNFKLIDRGNMMKAGVASWGRAVRAIALLIFLGVAAPALAQIAAPPARQAVDGNGVDLIHASFNTAMTDVSIGPAGAHGLAYTRYWQGGGWWNSLVATISGSTSNPIVSIGGKSDIFHLSGSAYIADQGNGATLVVVTGGDYVYTAANGTVARFAPTYTYSSTGGTTYEQYPGNIGIIRYIQQPDGTRLTFTLKGQTYCIYEMGDLRDLGLTLSTCPKANAIRLMSVTNSYGYQIKITYSSNTLTYINQLDAWNERTRVTAINNAVEYCDPGADNCALSNAWPHADYGYTSGQLTSVTDPEGRTSTYSYAGGLSGIRRPGASVDDISIGYGSPTTVTRQGVTTSYSFNTSGSTRTTTVTDAAGHVRTVVADLTLGFITSDTIQTSPSTSSTTTFTPDSVGRTIRITSPEGNYTDFEYDYGAAGGRGNVTKVTQVAKPGSGLSNIVTTANYPASCSNSFTCNQPTDTTDERGQMTEYVYDAGTGLVTSVKAPAPTGGGTRPETRYTYGHIQAQVKNSSGQLQATGQLVWVPSTISKCLSGSSCVGTPQEQVTWFSTYDNNLQTTQVQVKAGDNSINATTSSGYDVVGNITSTTDPLGKTSYAYYNADRQPVWVLTPDPDDGGTLRNRMSYTVYNGDGTIQNVQQGAANGDSSGFVQLQRIDYGYDGYGRKTSETLVSGGTAYAWTDYSYDGLGRPQCTAVRLNPASFGTTGACSLGATGADGPDRITLQEYDVVGRPWKTTEGYGVSGVQRTTVTNSYTANGKLATVTDAKGNVTTYDYDGFDRLFRTRYPNASGGGSSSSDYEELTYGTSGTTTNLVTSRRLRDNNWMAYEYDLLGRVTRMTPPGYSGNDVPLTYAYDNLGHLIQAIDTVNGHNVYFGYDALGRTVAESGPWHNRTMSYDLAGRLTSLNYGDGYSVSYTYDALGEMKDIYENGSTWLQSYGYDDLGRRIWTSRANGVSSNLTYDGADRLTNLAHDLAGTSNDISTTMSYNSAGQIAQRTTSNDAYSWADAYNLNRTYATNGLNQYTNISSNSPITPSYDGRGNLTGAGGPTFGYSARNLLSAVSTGAWFYYDALGRLDHDVGSNCAALESIGSNINAEIECGTGATLRRYVYGADNAPVVWYEGSGTGDKRWLLTDERGSVTAVTDGSGNAIRINTYDEYGIPGTNNLGRFQYTGQAWLPSIGMYYYRARIYSPTLGRFMQTDPIGYGDGPNWYNYVGSDPVNNVDPSGLLPIHRATFDTVLLGLLQARNEAREAGVEVGYWVHNIGDKSWLGLQASGRLGAGGDIQADLGGCLFACSGISIHSHDVGNTPTPSDDLFSGRKSGDIGTAINSKSDSWIISSTGVIRVYEYSSDTIYQLNEINRDGTLQPFNIDSMQGAYNINVNTIDGQTARVSYSKTGTNVTFYRNVVASPTSNTSGSSGSNSGTTKPEKKK